ncbi:cytochrome p450 [Pyrenophora tritici-repentis]|nr:cytochrome p450 [Pyrenophora tritici-repentis]
MFAGTTFVVLVILAPIIYRLLFHPLGRIPGPWFAAVSSFFLYLICYIGIEGRVTRYYHNKYKAKVLRVGPNTLSISDSSAIRDIYVSSGGYPKDARYTNFNLGPVETIFSTLDTPYRDLRAKAVSPLFSPAEIRIESQPKGSIGRHVHDFVTQLKAFHHAKIRTDLLDLCAKLSIDVVSDYLLGLPYGGLAEHAHLSLVERQTDEAKLSANAFVHAIVGFARFSLLPNWLFKKVYSVSQRLSHSNEVDKSFEGIAQFIDRVMAQTKASSTTGSERKRRLYQDRLLVAGVSFPETAVQSKAILFAGADSTAVALATTLFHLTRNDSARSRLLHEVRASASSTCNKQTELVFLRACVKEGLRLCMANPTRLTRVVPNGATLDIDGLHIPAGTVVGCAASVLHYDPTVFPCPFEFRPERWLDDCHNGGLRRPNMDRNLMPFGQGLRACLGKNLALHQLHLAVAAVVETGILEGAKTTQDRIEVTEWFNGDIKGHKIEIEW